MIATGKLTSFYINQIRLHETIMCFYILAVKSNIYIIIQIPGRKILAFVAKPGLIHRNGHGYFIFLLARRFINCNVLYAVVIKRNLLPAVIQIILQGIGCMLLKIII